MKKGNIFWGVFFVLAALFMVFSKLGYLGGLNVFTIVFAMFLVAIIIKSIRPLSFPGIIFPLAFLGILFDKQLGIESLTPWNLLIVATFLCIGLSLIFKKRYLGCVYYGSDEEVIDIADAERVTQKTSFGATTKYVNSEDFRVADFDCSFGAMSVYFEKAQIPSGNAVINAHVNFGGMELYVPKEWNVENHVQVSLGAVESKNRNNADGSVTVRLVGSISVGAIEIIYV